MAERASPIVIDKDQRLRHAEGTAELGDAPEALIAEGAGSWPATQTAGPAEAQVAVA